MALGLLLSAFARTEFQAVQFMPGVRLPADPALRPVRPARRDGPAARDRLDVLPLTYAYDALQRVGDDVIDARLALDVAIVLA